MENFTSSINTTMINLKTAILILGFTIVLFPQTTNKFQVSESLIDVRQTLISQFGQEMEERLKETETLNSNFYYAYLELENILDEESDVEKNVSKVPGGCNCLKRDGIIYISNYIGFMSGLNNLIQINLNDSTYSSKLIYHTDGEKSHKFTEAGEFIENIEVDIEKSSLVITTNSKFEYNGKISGKFIGTTIKYYEQDFSTKGFKEVQTKVLTIFECRMEDYDQKILDKDN